MQMIFDAVYISEYISASLSAAVSTVPLPPIRLRSIPLRLTMGIIINRGVFRAPFWAPYGGGENLLIQVFNLKKMFYANI